MPTIKRVAKQIFEVPTMDLTVFERLNCLNSLATLSKRKVQTNKTDTATVNWVNSIAVIIEMSFLVLVV
jgi:hypothetical protein